MLSASGSGGVDEVTIRKYVTLSIKDHIEKVQEAQDRLRNETVAQLQEFSTTLAKLESSLLQTTSSIKRTQESCKYVNKELETLKAKEKAAAEFQAETFNQTIADTIKREREAAEKEMHKMTSAHHDTQQALHSASARLSAEMEALQQEMRAQKLSGAIFSLRAGKLSEQRRMELVRELEQQVVGLPTHFDKILASPSLSPLPSAPPSEAGSIRAEPQQAASSRAPAAGSGDGGLSTPRGTAKMKQLDERVDRLEWKSELQQLAANIFCLRMMDADGPLRDNCLRKLEQKHQDMSESERHISVTSV